MTESNLIAESDLNIKTLIYKKWNAYVYSQIFSQSQRYFEFYRICVQLQTLKTQNECYLYSNLKLIVYYSRLNKTCHVFVFMQPSSSTSFHVSFNNYLILSIHTSFDCVENILNSLNLTKFQNFMIFVSP